MSRASMDGSKPAICGHLKTGHFRRPETGVEIYFTASSVGNVFIRRLFRLSPESMHRLASSAVGEQPELPRDQSPTTW